MANTWDTRLLEGATRPGAARRAGGSLGRPRDDARGEVEQVAVDLPQVPHLVLQLGHTDPQLVLAAQDALGKDREPGRLRVPDGAGARGRPLPAPWPRPTFSIVPLITACSCSARSRWLGSEPCNTEGATWRPASRGSGPAGEVPS